MAFLSLGAMETVPSAMYELEASIPVAKVPSWFPVGFRLLTEGSTQVVAFYDVDHNMTVASRQLDSEEWTFQVLPSKVGWDSHNYIALALDSEGQLHVSGNMHADPLVYFRTEMAGDIRTLKAFPMTGKEGDRVTYPRFIKDDRGELIFNYRTGGSGRGARFFNVYDTGSRTWSRLLDKPFLDGEGERNAYPRGPIKGPDGYFHLVWVWRDTPDCATNHHLSHARSRDLIHWESAFGDKVELPLVLASELLWIDPIPPGGGIINGCERLFFDEQERPVVTYHKSDEDGNMQIYAARAEARGWKIHRLTDWKKPVPFGGFGTMGFIGIRISGLSRVESGVLTIHYEHKDYGKGRLFLDEKTLRPLDETFRILPEIPPALEIPESSFEGMGIQRRFDSGKSTEAGVRYLLQWETLPSHHDRPREGPLPEPSLLRVHKLVRVSH